MWGGSRTKLQQEDFLKRRKRQQIKSSLVLGFILLVKRSTLNQMKSQKVQSNPENIFIVKYENGRQTLNHTQQIIEFCLKSMQVGPSVSKWVSQLVSQSDGQSVSQLDSQVISPSVSPLDGWVISQSGGETIRYSVRQLDSQVISQSFSKTVG